MFNMRYMTLLIMIFFCKTLHTTITQQHANIDMCNEFALTDRQLVFPPTNTGFRN